jgi:hypothetical protein
LVGLVLCAFDLAVTQAIGLVKSGLDFLLDGEREVEGHRRDRFDDQLADGGIDLGADDALAQRVAEELATARAYVVGDELTTAPHAVVDVHPTAAEAANGASLQ